LNFPYTSIDGAGVATNSVFQSRRGSVVSNKLQPYWTLFGFESGGLKHFGSFDFSFGNGVTFSGGYGFTWYFNGPGEHEKNIVDKRFVFKASMNIAWELYAGKTSLGTIDNTNKTISLLGYTATPTFYVSTTTDDGNGNEITETIPYQAQNLNVSYSQTELLLVPKIGIGNNPYRGGDSKKLKLLWDLSVGYNLPFYNKGGIQLTQNDGEGNSRNLNSSLIGLKTPDLTFMYNGKRTSSTLFHYSGLSVAFSIRLGESKYY